MDNKKESKLNEPDLQEGRGRGMNEPDLQEGCNSKGGLNSPDWAFTGVKKIRCRNCRQLVEVKGDVCPNCSHYIYEKETRYEPMQRKTANKIRFFLGLGLLAVFAGLVFFGVIELKACSDSTQTLLGAVARGFRR